MIVESIVACVILGTVGYFCYLAGKQEGSRKGFGAGRYGQR
jgi:hypothetical protein